MLRGLRVHFLVNEDRLLRCWVFPNTVRLGIKKKIYKTCFVRLLVYDLLHCVLCYRFGNFKVGSTVKHWGRESLAFTTHTHTTGLIERS